MARARIIGITTILYLIHLDELADMCQVQETMYEIRENFFYPNIPITEVYMLGRLVLLNSSLIGRLLRQKFAYQFYQDLPMEAHRLRKTLYDLNSSAVKLIWDSKICFPRGLADVQSLFLKVLHHA